MKKMNFKYKMSVLACTLFLVSGAVCTATNNDNTQATSIALGTEILQDKVSEFKKALTVTKDELRQFDDNTSYIDSEGNLYEFSEDGNVSGYMKCDYEMDNSTIITKNQAIAIADSCLKIYTDSNNYSMVSVDYNSSLAYYRVVYSYYIGEYATTDGMYFDVSAKGEVIDFVAQNTGKFNGIKVQAKEKSELIECARRKIAAENPKCSDIIVSKVMIGSDENGIFYSAGAIGVDTVTGESKQMSTIIRIE